MTNNSSWIRMGLKTNINAPMDKKNPYFVVVCLNRNGLQLNEHPHQKQQGHCTGYASYAFSLTTKQPVKPSNGKRTANADLQAHQLVSDWKCLMLLFFLLSTGSEVSSTSSPYDQAIGKLWISDLFFLLHASQPNLTILFWCCLLPWLPGPTSASWYSVAPSELQRQHHTPECHRSTVAARAPHSVADQRHILKWTALTTAPTKREGYTTDVAMLLGGGVLSLFPTFFTH